MSRITVETACYGASFRTIPMLTILSDFVSEYLKTLKGIYLFTTQQDELITKSAMNRMWRSIVFSMNIAIVPKYILQYKNPADHHIDAAYPQA